jgi:hypothetical protein
MAVTLDYTLIELGIKTLVKEGSWKSIKPRRTNGATMFIGCAVSGKGQTFPDIVVCPENQPILGFITGIAVNKEGIPTGGRWYNDYDNMFADNKWVNVGIPNDEMIILVLSATGATIYRDSALKVVDGVFQHADTDDRSQMTAMEPVPGTTNIRKYFYARFDKAR